MTTKLFAADHGPDLTGRLAGGSYPDDDVLVRLMRACDDDLSIDEQTQLQADLGEHPEWNSILRDIGRGTDLARCALAISQAEADDRPAAHVLSFAKDARRTKQGGFAQWVNYRQAAAIAIGLALGVAGSRLLLQPDAADTELRLAGIAATDGKEEAQQHALKRALVVLLNDPAGQMREVEVNDQAADVRGVVALNRNFNLGAGIPCTEFSFAPQDQASLAMNGIACHQPAGGWQIMTITSNQ